MLIAFIAIASCYKEDPLDYEAQSVSHIDYEKDQMPVNMSVDGSSKVKRLVDFQANQRIQVESDVQTPAQDRNWQVKQKPKSKSKSKRMSGGKQGRKVHIYLNNDDSKTSRTPKSKKQHATSTTTELSSSTHHEAVTELSTRRTPELTTKSDKDVRNIQYVDKDTIAAGSSQSDLTVTPKDTESEGSAHYDHVIKEKIKIKHHHHHHHHNHVKTVVKKEPYPVEKVIHVPVEKIVEKKVPYKVEVPVEKIVEKVQLSMKHTIGS